MRSSPAPRRVRAALTIGTALLTSGALVACTGGEEEPGADGTAGTSPTPSEGDGSAGGESSEAPDDETAETADPTEVTPPGTELEPDQRALVPINLDSRGTMESLFYLSLDSIERGPASALARIPGGPPPEPSDLWYIRQTWELVDRMGGGLGLALPNSHTLALADGIEVQNVNASLPGCPGTLFGDQDQPGTTYPLCTAVVAPKGDPPDSVVFYDANDEYDGLLDGDYVYWPFEVDGETDSPTGS